LSVNTLNNTLNQYYAFILPAQVAPSARLLPLGEFEWQLSCLPAGVLSARRDEHLTSREASRARRFPGLAKGLRLVDIRSAASEWV
jgi:hypothetical protein